ncbi:MAG TPA: ATP-binding protein [Herpetosiphonaceae bacterium]
MSHSLEPAAITMNDDSYQHLKHKYDRLRLVYEVSQQLSSTLSLPHVLQQVLHRTTSSTGATRGSIILVDEHGVIQQHLYTRKLHYSAASAFTSVVVQRGLAGWVLAHGESALVANTDFDPRWIDFPGELVDVRSAVAVPLTRGRRVRGVLTLVHPDRYFFNQDDLELLNAIAHHASMAIENARLLAGINDERRKFEGAVTAMEEGLILVDAEGQIQFMNPQGLSLFKLSPPLPSRLAELSPDLQRLLDKARSRGETARTELAIAGPPRLDLSVNITYAPGLSERSDWWTIVLHDITTLKNYDRLKTQFVANASHELRTPLANIKMYANLAENGKPERRPEFLRTIASEAARLESLVEDILTLSRIDSGMLPNEPRVVQLEELLGSIAQTYEPLAQDRRVRLSFVVIDSPLPVTWVDPGHITRVVVNLLGNALKFTPGGGTVTMSLSLQSRDHLPGAVLAVSDTGVGISVDDQHHLFDRFYRVSNVDANGTGLGLTIINELLALMGGNISVESVPNRGSTFRCWIPITPPPTLALDDDDD